jgi:hypothetical protein
MTSAISINIGLNHVDADAYGGWDGQLAACVNDARCMQQIADDLGYSSVLLLDEEATADRVICEIGNAAREIDEGGILLLTYSGHGGQMPDTDGDEDDNKDETWVLYDRQLVDDELYNLWNQFGAGTRIVVLSDSCHSGSVTRDQEYQALAASPGLARHYRTRGGPPRFRAMPMQVGAADYQHRRRFYDAQQFAAGARKRADMEASVLLISGCQDNQLSSDGDVNGLFTAKLLEVWGNGDFEGSYYSFHQAIVDRMPATQTPNYYTVGTSNPDLEAQKPFTVAIPGSGSGGGGGEPTPGAEPELSIEGPASVPRGAPPPVFSVHVEDDRYFAVEVAAEPELFDTTDVGHVRNDSNFYGSWSDTSLMEGALSQYKLPHTVWGRLAQDSERLYYRVLSSRRQDAWDGYEVSNRDTDGEAIPALQIEG